MTRVRFVAIVGLMLLIVEIGVGVAAVRLGRRHSPQAQASCESAATAIADLRGEVARLREELARTKAAAAVLAVAGAAARASVNEHCERPQAPLVFPTPVSETVDISAEELLQSTEEQFRSEGKDPVWSGQAELIARRQLSSSISGDRGQLQLECRASLCRAEVTYPNPAAYDLVAESASTESPAWRGARATSLPSRTMDDKIVVVHYLFKEGEDSRRP